MALIDQLARRIRTLEQRVALLEGDVHYTTLYDGGSAFTVDFTGDIDGGVAATAIFDSDIDGGNA
jgi:hypothetical protein